MDSIDSATKKFRIPLLNDSVSAGFPSPADDYTEENIDLNEHLISNPFSTFFLRVKGDSMVNAGIKNKKINFLIGDTDGISSDIKKHSDLILSLSPLTFPHELARLILIEQIYRAVSISKNSPYHRS